MPTGENLFVFGSTGKAFFLSLQQLSFFSVLDRYRFLFATFWQSPFARLF